MRQLKLQSSAFQYVIHSIKEWLETLGYNESTVYQIPNYLTEFFYFLEKNGLQEIHDITEVQIQQHFRNLERRKHQRREGGLSPATLNKHKQAIHLLLQYLRKVGRLELEKPILLMQSKEVDEIRILSIAEIKELYHQTEINREPPLPEIFNARDRTILTVYYGTGLRRKEGEHLHVSDIHFERGYIQVRKGKNYTNRQVPITNKQAKYLEDYIYNHRPKLLKSATEGRLFLNYRGKPMGSQSIYNRMKLLLKRANINSEGVGLHTLRHSIATHLLEAGMDLELISRFLGHKSLETTQIYTHTADVETKQPFSNIPKRTVIRLFEDEL